MSLHPINIIRFTYDAGLSNVVLKVSQSLVAVMIVCGLICTTSLATAQETQQQPKPKTNGAKQDDEKKADEEKVEPMTVQVAEGNIRFKASGTWKSVKPASRIVEFEIKVPKVKGDTKDGRLTIMGAGGSIEANIDRWKKQFIAPEGETMDGNTKVKKEKHGGQDVTIVDITGTFMDAPGGPFSGQPKVERPDYRMMAAIIQTKEDGNYFVKLYGPKKTMKQNEKHFKAMIKSVNVAD